MKDNRARYAACIFACTLLFSVLSSTHGVLLTPMIDQYALTQSKRGLMNAAQNAGCMIALVTSLFLIGRVAKPRLHAAAAAAMAVIAVPLGFAPPFALLTFLFLLMGVAMGYVDTLSSSTIADMYDGAAAAKLMCVLHAVFGIGGIATPLAVSALLNAGLKWNYVYLLAAALGAPIIACTIPLSRARERAGAAEKPLPRLARADVAGFFKSRARVMLVAAIAACALQLGVISVWIGRYMSEVLNSSLGALAMALFWLGTTACRLLFSLVTVNPVKYTRFSMLGAGVALIIGTLSHNAVVMCVMVCLSALMSGAVIPMLLHMACRQYRENTLFATTIMFISLYLAQGGGQPLMGAIEASAGLTFGMVLLGMVCCVCGAVMFGVKASDY